MNTWTAKHFKAKEFDQPGMPGSGEKYMNRDFVALLDRLRAKVGPLHINSGYRSADYNSRVSTTGETGPHTTGKASDIRCHDSRKRFLIVKTAMELGFTGIGIGKGFVHLDTLKEEPGFSVRPNLWTY